MLDETSGLHDVLEDLKRITKTSLSKQYENVKEFCEASVNKANQCDIDMVLKNIAFAERAAQRLREDAARHWHDGEITLKEYGEINELTIWLILEKLPQEVSNNIVYSCGCVKGGTLSNN